MNSGFKTGVGKILRKYACAQVFLCTKGMTTISQVVTSNSKI